MTKIVCISDTHNQHDKLIIPKADILIHAGDLTNRGTLQELKLVAEWMKKLLKDKVISQIVLTCGNHDLLFEDHEQLARSVFSEVPNLHILINESIVIEDMKFYGAPQTIFFFDWAYNIPKDSMYTYWDKIPDDTDVLITHQPPYGTGDAIKHDDLPGLPRSKSIEHLGCKALRDRVQQIQPRLHVWGHIHTGSGYYQHGKTQMVNAAQLNEQYMNTYQPYQIEI